MWSDFKPLTLSRQAAKARINSLEWKNWKPQGIVLHNTAAPTLAQWVELGPKHDERIRNLQKYYEGLGWHGGPHWFISRDWINEFNNPLRRGTHSPSFNATHFGIEMVGDYDKEPFDEGDGSKVRDNAVFLMAVLCKKFGWDPAKVIKFHKEDPKTTHDCPGKLVNKKDVIRRVQQQLELLDARAPDTAPIPVVIVAPPNRHMRIYATEFDGPAEPQESAYGGKVDGDAFEVALPMRLPSGKRHIKVFCGGKSALGKVNDVGPWNIRDDYPLQPGKRPLAEGQFSAKTKAQNNRVPTNPAGIDLTPAFFNYFGIPGKPGTRSTYVDWEFSED